MQFFKMCFLFFSILCNSLWRRSTEPESSSSSSTWHVNASTSATSTHSWPSYVSWCCFMSLIILSDRTGRDSFLKLLYIHERLNWLSPLKLPLICKQTWHSAASSSFAQMSVTFFKITSVSFGLSLSALVPRPILVPPAQRSFFLFCSSVNPISVVNAICCSVTISCGDVISSPLVAVTSHDFVPVRFPACVIIFSLMISVGFSGGEGSCG